MGDARPFELDFSSPELPALPVYRRLGLLNGLLIGLALGLGAWGVEAWGAGRLPLPLFLPTLLLGILLMTALGGFVGWLSARLARTAITVVLWLAAAVLAILLMGYLSYYGRSLVVWVADLRFFGRMVFPYNSEGTAAGFILGGLLVLLVLGFLGVLQEYRLENMAGEAQRKRTLGLRTWLALLLPLPLVFLAGLITQNMMANPAATAAQLTHRAILRAQVYDGDLRELGEENGINYTALRPVQDQIAGPFTLGIAEVNPQSSTVIIVADFDSGAWVYCRVINDQLSFCYDPSPAYITGLRSHVTGEPVPEECRACNLRASGAAAAWLAERRPQFGAAPVISREAQWGDTVLMRVESESGDVSARCWVTGVTRAELTSCEEAR